ncbi:MAG: hypothetical protein U0835_02175 [Isosphaeraceae bacterium]
MRLFKLSRLVRMAIACGALATPLAGNVNAQLILTTNTTTGPFGNASNSSGPAGQQFSLLQSLTIDKFDAKLFPLTTAPATTNVTMEIWGGGSNTSFGSLLYTSANPASLPSANTLGDATFTFTGAALTPGLYWAVLRNTSSSLLIWQNWNSGITGPSNAFGSINAKTYDPSNGFSGVGSSAPYMLAIYQSTSAVPEPSSLQLGLGLTAIGAGAGLRSRWRRRPMSV